MDYKESLERSENFAKEIIKLAAAKGLTVCELYKAADIRLITFPAVSPRIVSGKSYLEIDLSGIKE